MTRRPNVLRWLAYAYGFGLPAANREWVLFDVTTRTWVLRHFARTTVQLAPILLAVYLLLPVAPSIGAGAVLGGAVMGYFYSVAYMVEIAEHRAVKAGYPRGTATSIRAAAHEKESRGNSQRYAEQWREQPEPPERPEPS